MRLPLLLLAALAGCGGEECIASAGHVCITAWSSQQDRASLPAEVARAERIAQRNGSTVKGAVVRFTEDATADCHQPRKVAGCVGIVEVRPTLRETALVHELLHVAQARVTGGFDYAHADPRWWATRGDDE